MPSCVTLQCIKLLASQVLPSIMYTCCCRCQGPEHFVKTDSKQQAVINEDEKVNISRETCFEKKIISDSWLNFSAIYLFDLCIFHSESEFISYGFTSSVFGLLELIDCLIFLWCRKQRWEFVPLVRSWVLNWHKMNLKFLDMGPVLDITYSLWKYQTLLHDDRGSGTLTIAHIIRRI